MKLKEIFARKNIIHSLKSTQKPDTIREMVQQLAKSGAIPKGETEDVERALMRREELGSTGIGKGVAVPHAKHPAVEGVIGAFGRSEKGIAFNALDDQPVHLVFLLISAPDAVEPHLAALRKLMTLLKDGDLCAFMKRAKDVSELVELLAEADDRLPK